MATVAELQDIAREMDLNFTSKTRKGELEKMITDERERRAEEANTRFVEANSKPIPRFIAQRQGLMPKTPPKNIPLTLEQRVRNYGGEIVNGTPKRLTPAQKRRMRKKVNQHGE